MATGVKKEPDIITPLLKDIESFPKYTEIHQTITDESIDEINAKRENLTMADKLKTIFGEIVKTFSHYDLENNPVTRCLDTVSCLKTCTSVCCISIQIVCAALPIAMIAIGAIHLNDCPVERFIPIYLIVGGSFAVALLLVDIIMITCRAQTAMKWLVILIALFSTAWLIAGSVWVYRSYKGLDTDNPESGSYCHPSAYYLAFWVITIVYGILGICIFILGLLGLIGCCYTCCICCQISECFVRPDLDKTTQENPERFLEASLEKGFLKAADAARVEASINENLSKYLLPEEEDLSTNEHKSTEIPIY